MIFDFPEGYSVSVMTWKQIHPLATPEMLGFIPSFLSLNDPRPARKQMIENYGYWHPMDGFTFDPDTRALVYPGDPPYPCLWETELRNETIRFYTHEILAIFQPDRTFEASRVS